MQPRRLTVAPPPALAAPFRSGLTLSARGAGTVHDGGRRISARPEQGQAERYDWRERVGLTAPGDVRRNGTLRSSRF